MGYYTKFDLNARPAEKLAPALKKLFPETDVEDGDDPLEEAFKWYDHQQELTSLSKEDEFKDVLFVLDGEGEESHDTWRLFVCNGKTERIKMPKWVPPNEPSNLK